MRLCYRLESDLNYLRRDVELVKEEINQKNRDLSILISCYHQLQLQGVKVESQSRRDKKVYESRRNEVPKTFQPLTIALLC